MSQAALLKSHCRLHRFAYRIANNCEVHNQPTECPTADQIPLTAVQPHSLRQTLGRALACCSQDASYPRAAPAPAQHLAWAYKATSWCDTLYLSSEQRQQQSARLRASHSPLITRTENYQSTLAPKATERALSSATPDCGTSLLPASAFSKSISSSALMDVALLSSTSCKPGVQCAEVALWLYSIPLAFPVLLDWQLYERSAQLQLPIQGLPHAWQ